MLSFILNTTGGIKFLSLRRCWCLAQRHQQPEIRVTSFMTNVATEYLLRATNICSTSFYALVGVLAQRRQQPEIRVTSFITNNIEPLVGLLPTEASE